MWAVLIAAICCSLLAAIVLGVPQLAFPSPPLVPTLAFIATAGTSLAAAVVRRRSSRKATSLPLPVAQPIKRGRKHRYAQDLAAQDPPQAYSLPPSPPPHGAADAEPACEQSGVTTAELHSLLVRAQLALASLLPDDTTFRSHMASCLETIRAKTEAPTPGRRPGYKAKRYHYLDALPESHPKRPSRLEVYEALDALLKAVWPQPLSSAQKMRRWRANEDNRDRARTHRQGNRQRQRAEAKREAEVLQPTQPRVRQRGTTVAQAPQLDAPPQGSHCPRLLRSSARDVAGASQQETECEAGCGSTVNSVSDMNEEMAGGAVLSGAEDATGDLRTSAGSGIEEAATDEEAGGDGEARSAAAPESVQQLLERLPLGQYVQLRLPPGTYGRVTDHQHELTGNNVFTPNKVCVRLEGADRSKAFYVADVVAADAPPPTRNRCRTVRRCPAEVAAEEQAARERRAAAAEKVRAERNKEAQTAVGKQVKKKSEEWPLLPQGRRIPSRVLWLITGMIRRGPRDGGDFATLADVQELELTNEEVAMGEDAREAVQPMGAAGPSETAGPSTAAGRRPSGATGGGKARQGAADDLEAELASAAVGARVLTGRMDDNEAKSIGAPFPMRSVNLKVDIPHRFLNAATDQIPAELTPKDRDTKESLLSRLKADSYLDWINGYYPKFKAGMKQNLTNFNTAPGSKQPKRRSESVVVKPEHTYTGSDGEGWGQKIWRLFNYTSCQRRPDDWRGAPMSWAWFVVGLFLWVACWPYLTPISRRMPPTHMQLLLYYAVLDAVMNAHRDNSSSADIDRFIQGEELGEEGHPSAGAVNSQRIGSNVMVLTLGTRPMTFTLRFPPKHNLTVNRKSYIVSPRCQMHAGFCTVSILDPVDDLTFTYGAEFEIVAVDDKKASWWRVAATWRWLQAAEDFYSDTRGLRLDKAKASKLEGYARSDEVFPRPSLEGQRQRRSRRAAGRG